MSSPATSGIVSRMTQHPMPLPILMALSLLTAGCRPAPSTPLARAAFAGDVEQVRRLLAATSADTAADSLSPLIWAARADRVEAMTLLLDAGADPNRPDGHRGWTPLMHALHTQARHAALLLLARGADGALGAGGTSPLEMAALDDDADVLERLLAAQPGREQRIRAFDLAVSGGALADIDRPLMGRCRPDAVRVLLASDPGLAGGLDGFGTPIWWARRQGCDDVVAWVAAARASNLAQKTP